MLKLMGKKIFTFSAEMAYHNTRPPIAVTFPKPLVSLLHMGLNPNPELGNTVNQDFKLECVMNI